GLPLDEYLRRHLFEPLGMTDTGHIVDADKQSRLVPLFRRTEDGHGWARFHRNAPQRWEFLRGGGGMHSTPNDYLKFVRMLLNRGRSGTRQILSEQLADRISQNVTGSIPVS